jgi:aspartate/tyrosine/aromatic aminotransferase
MAAPDAIMGLTEEFKKDPNPEKINLTIGVYKDDSGQTPIFASVKKAEARLLEDETTKSYLSIEGEAAYGACVQSLVFGDDHEIVTGNRAVTAHTPGGTGALRIAGEFLAKIRPGATLWLSQPTWPNHPAVFKAAGLNIKTYPYYDADLKSLDFEAMTNALKDAGEEDIVLFHGCCHNPTGMDPNREQWKILAQLTHDRGFLPFFDFAYQGLGAGLEEDAEGLRIFCTEGCEMLVASSFSKNFGLYRERTGALTLVAGDSEAAQSSLSQLKSVIRANYSNPPAHGAAIVTAVLTDAQLTNEWKQEVLDMCERINSMRKGFVETLNAKGVAEDYSFLTRQKGMFSFSGLTPEHVERLRAEFGIYIVGSGRINVASITSGNIDRLCECIAKVVAT